MGDYTVYNYELPECGVVTHMMATPTVNAREFEADWLLVEYQKSNIPFVRNRMHTASGITRTSHFTYNVVSLTSFYLQG